MNARHSLLELFDAALRAVDGRACVARHLPDPALVPPCHVFAIGKAAGAMALGAHDALGRGMTRALVITKDGHADSDLRRVPGLTLIESAHPVPDQRSLSAGAALTQAVREIPADAAALFLVSGGSSSLVEALRPGATLEQLRDLNVRGLAAGWDIARLNRERATLSKLKGGGLTRLLGGRAALALFVSDVPDDDPEVIGSGLLGSAGARDRVERRIVADVDVAVRAAVAAGSARGLVLEPRAARFDGAAEDVAREFLATLRTTPADGIVWGGESTVALSSPHGRGGRNMHLALAAARGLRHNEGFTILAAGTDGTDGPTEDAGAIVDAGTVERAELGGADVERALREFDSATALEVAGDLVHTGPTGTNVGDVLIGLKRSSTSVRDAVRGHML